MVFYIFFYHLFHNEYNVPLIPAYVTRIGQQSKFLVTIEKPLELDNFKKSNQEQAISEITLLINKKLEGWIKKHPEQWFWVHNRWKS
jgi:KDO2-lipid IV(A) lauroyltransferase